MPVDARSKLDDVARFVSYALRKAALAIAGVTAALQANSASAQTVRNMTLTEDLRISSDESSPERALTNVLGLVVLNGGTIVTAHNTEGLLRLFDSTGKFIRTTGRRGQGPGEFRGISAFGARGDSVWVYDVQMARVTVFPKNGAEPRTVAIPLTTRRAGGDVVGLFGDGRILFRKDYHRTLPGQMAYIDDDPPHSGMVTLNWAYDSTQFSVANTAGTERLHLYTWRRTPQPWLRAPMDGEEKAFPELFAPAVSAITTGAPPSARLLLDAGLWNGTAGEVRVIAVAPNFTVDTSRLAFPPRPLSRAFADSQVKRIASGFATSYYEGKVNAVEAANFEAEVRRKLLVPAHIPVVSRAIAGDDGSVWINDRFDRDVWLVVSSTGALSRVRMPANVRLVHATLRRVWGVAATPDDVPILVRYAVR